MLCPSNMNCYRCGDKYRSKNQLLSHLKKCKKDTSIKKFKTKNCDVCFLCDKKLSKKAGGSKLYLPDFIGIEINFYKCLFCSKYTSKNLQKEQYFFNTYKGGKYADMYTKSMKVPIVLSWG